MWDSIIISYLITGFLKNLQALSAPEIDKPEWACKPNIFLFLFFLVLWPKPDWDLAFFTRKPDIQLILKPFFDFLTIFVLFVVGRLIVRSFL